MNNKVVINLNLLTLKFPFTAMLSFLHRVSGLFIFLLIPFLLYFFEKGSGTQTGFNEIVTIFKHPLSKIGIFLFLTAFWYHLIAGVRHILMDLGFAEGLKSARVTGAISLLLTLLFAVLSGAWLW